ncbi:MAG: DUF86 domain-containing protein [Endomicrobium sp.]|jgi:uncharacterized protein with HEPN domain|nr:DUF86 domain-containing protein [Endomicrobium sp.]
MSSDKEYIDYIQDIILSCLDVKSFIKNSSKENFCSDKKTIYATIRAIEIIGEASKKIPLNIRSQYINIPWKEIAGMRDKLIHDYFGIDVEVLWKTAKYDVAYIKFEFEKILKNIKKYKI